MSPTLCLTLLAVSGCTTQGAMVAQVDGGGGFRLSQGGTLLANVGYAVALKGWSFHSPDGNGKSPSLIRTPQGEVQVLFSIQPSTSGLLYTVEAVPKSNLDIESAHISFKSPIGRWIGGAVEVDGRPIEVTPVSKGLSMFAGSTKSVRIRKGALSVLLEVSGGDVSIEDRRQWEPQVEVRVGVQRGLWPAGQKRTYRMAMNLGTSVEVKALEPYVVGVGPEWAPLETPLDVEPGSALDWSENRPAAGTKGWLRVNAAGFFEFAKTPGKREKFYGANLCFSAANPDKETADKVARRLKMLGYNTVRLHHYDSELTGRWDNKGPDSTVLDPEAMDRFDYFFSKLKENGLYVKIDLFTIRQIRENEVLPGKLGMDEYKALLLFHKGAQENWLKFARNLLTHRNPYTKLAYKDDPALAWICTVNENNFGSATRDLKPETRALLQKEFERWGGKGIWSYETDEGARFGGHLHATSFLWMRDQLRALGVKALLTDNNGWHDSNSLIQNRSQLDFVDNHFYWAHPSFLGGNWSLPSRHTNESMIPSLPGALAGLSATRIFGKPFTVSELNSSAPNQFRGESGLIFGALAAIQDWDIVWRFAYSHSEEAMDKQVGLDYFNVATDPANLAGERAMIALFQRGDMPAAASKAVKPYDASALGAQATAPASNELFTVQIGSTLGRTASGGTAAAPLADLDLDQGTLAVSGVRTQGAIVPPGRQAKAKGLAVSASGYQANLWVTALDGQKLETSRRMLLTHVTDVQNEGSRFRSPDRDVLEAWGGPRKLMHRGSAEVTLEHAQASQLKVYRLEMSGKRSGTIPVKVSGRNLSFSVSTDDPRGATMYYEIVRE